MAEKHIGSREAQYIVVSIAPDVCKVGDSVVPFDSFQDLSHEKSYVSNVRARGNPILTVDSIIASTQSNAGKGINSGTSLGSGDCHILTGVNHIKCKGKPVARHDSLVAMNNGNTVGKLYTQVNSANPEIPVENTSLWDRYSQLQRQMEEGELEARKQEPDAIIGLAKEFANGWYRLGVLLGKSQMQGRNAQMDADIAIMQALGMDTRTLEQASEASKKIIEAINIEERLFEPASAVQEMAMKAEPYLELLTGLAAVTKGIIKFAGIFSSRAGRNGVKVVKTAGETKKSFGSFIVDRKLPRDKHGNPIPDSDLPHSQLGTKSGRKENYNQAREWGYDENGKLVPKRDIDFTDHGRSDHVNPHQHDYIPNPTGGTLQRGAETELVIP